MTEKSRELRDARQGDLEAIYEIEKLSFSDPYPKNLLKSFLFFPGAYIVVLEGGRLVGYAIGVIRHTTLGHVISIAIAPGNRRSGIGQELLGELVKKLGQCGAKEITLEVRESNAAAISLYTKMGFGIGREIKRYYPDGETALEMNLSLK